MLCFLKGGGPLPSFVLLWIAGNPPKLASKSRARSYLYVILTCLSSMPTSPPNFSREKPDSGWNFLVEWETPGAAATAAVPALEVVGGGTPPFTTATTITITTRLPSAPHLLCSPRYSRRRWPPTATCSGRPPLTRRSTPTRTPLSTTSTGTTRLHHRRCRCLSRRRSTINTVAAAARPT